MFQPETEDMLPRMAPKPSHDMPMGANDGIVKPQVPEVSILFGQQDANLQQGINLNIDPQRQDIECFPQQTYAAWKKQVLPKVAYPATANMAELPMRENKIFPPDYNSSKTNLYSIKSCSIPASNTNLNSYVDNNSTVANHKAYRRSLESCNGNVYAQVQHVIRPTHARDILTLCAGTQTDASLECSLQSEWVLNLASKKDVENIRQILDEMKSEQQRLLKVLESCLMNYHAQMTVKPERRDVGIQTDRIVKDMLPGDIELAQENKKVATNKFVQQLKSSNVLQTPKDNPMAQSTTYRPIPQQYQLLQPSSNLPKSASDTSLAMNELALKYLPNEKLTELLKELNMDCLPITHTNLPSSSVKVNIHKFEKGCTDISNASYKYLKKYRLLPDDHQENGNNKFNNAAEAIENCNQNQLLEYNLNSPQYNIKHTEANPRQIPTNNCSPYAGRPPLSPLVRSSPQSAVPQHIVNLENIKQQPKFL